MQHVCMLSAMQAYTQLVSFVNEPARELDCVTMKGIQMIIL